MPTNTESGTKDIEHHETKIDGLSIDKVCNIETINKWHEWINENEINQIDYLIWLKLV